MSAEEQLPVTELITACQSLIDAGELGLASQKANQAIDRARRQGDTFLTAEAMLKQTAILCRLGHYPAAIGRAKEVLAMLPETSSETSARLRTLALTALGISASETDNLDAGEEYHRQAMDTARLGNLSGDCREFTQSIGSDLCSARSVRAVDSCRTGSLAPIPRGGHARAVLGGVEHAKLCLPDNQPTRKIFRCNC